MLLANIRRRVSSVVEHLFCNQGVTGSNPVLGSMVRKCPTCNQERTYARRNAYIRNGRPKVKSASTVRIRLPKKAYNIVRVQRRWGLKPIGYTYVMCSDPFHTAVEQSEPKRLPPPKHDGSDLKQLKDNLSRALQGKDRR